MQNRLVWTFGGFILGLGAAFLLTHSLLLRAQLSERPGNTLDPPIEFPRDLSGLSIKNPRIRIVHTTDPWQAGGSMYLQQVDPWLGYQWGRSLTQRNFRQRDGVYGDNGKIEGILLADGVSKMMDRSHTNSCGACHNVPYRDAGAGMTIAKNGGSGRNTPHMFGAGLVEMIGLQIRLLALAQADSNRDGWISFEEMKGKRLIISNLPRGTDWQSVLHSSGTTSQRHEIDYGSFDDEDGNGYPDLNAVFFPIFVDMYGQRIAFARNLKSPDVAGYTFEFQVFGFGHLYLPFRPPVSTTIRSFTLTPFEIHSGMQAHDPTIYTSPRRDALALVSNPGAQQFVTAAGKDRGGVKTTTKTGLPGISLDDPDRDGYCEEISEGDLDLAEWYLLNHPSPTQTKISPEVALGEKLFHKVGCATCHIPDWRLFSHNPRAEDYTQLFDGDRRFFDLQVAFNDKSQRMEGKLVSLADKVSDQKGTRWVPKRGAYTVRGIYSDFKYHDVGEEFYQMQFDGSLIRQWRTPPLWGVGHTAPYGHDGASLDLDSVIRRHGGEALESRKHYAALSDTERKQLLCFLQSLVLYQTDQLPCDLDGDGTISDHFIVQGMDTGIERFNPDWLFNVPGKMEGPIRNIQGLKIFSLALTNVPKAYGLDLEFLRDADEDGFPDVIDPEPRLRGYRDGSK